MLCVALPAVGVIAVVQQVNNAKAFLLAWSVLFIAGTIAAAAALDIFPPLGVNAYSLKLGSALESVVLSLGLAQRLRRIRRDKEQAHATLLAEKAGAAYTSLGPGLRINPPGSGIPATPDSAALLSRDRCAIGDTTLQSIINDLSLS